MPSAIPTQSQPQELAAQLVANPVSATSFAQIAAAQAHFALARALPSVVSVAPHEVTATGTALTVPIQWWPSPGCRLALVTVDLQGAWYIEVFGRVFTDRKRATVALTVPSGAGVVVDSTLLDGSETLAQRDPLSATRTTYTGYVHLGDWGDVTDAVQDLAVTVDDVGGDTHQGLAAITLTEIPVATLRPESGELGVLLPSLDPRNDLHDGDSSIGSGVPELLTAEQDTLRTRWHWQIATYEHTSYAWTRSSATIGQLDWVGTVGTSVDPVFRVRVPAIYGTSANAMFKLRIRYNATEDGTVRVVRDVVGAGTSNADDGFAASGGTWAVFEGSLSLSASGTEQEMDLSFHFSTLDASPVYVSSIAIIQEEQA